MTNRDLTPIFLDCNATTPVAAEVREKVAKALGEAWGNPSSAHPVGRRAREVVEEGRGEVAALLHAGPGDIVFTSGGTESDNAAVIGVAEALADRGRHIVTTAIEHPAVDRACAYLEARGWSVTRVLPRPDGAVGVDDVEAALRPDSVLVSVMHANNETGVLQPVAAIARRAHARGCVVHTDAAQSVGKIDVDVDALEVDLLTVAGHKLYAPKGVGALFIRAGTPFAPYLKGGGHESGRRAGTENTGGIAGFGAACALARREGAARSAHMAAMRDRLADRLRQAFPAMIVHGLGADRLPNTLSVAFPGLRATDLLDRLDGIAASAGAACHAGHDTPSAVLLAMGVPAPLARATLRLSTGRDTTPAEIDRAASLIEASAPGLI